MLEIVLDLVDQLLTRSGRSPVDTAVRPYARAHRQARRTGVWDETRLVEALRERSVPGAYVEAENSIAAITLVSWRNRLAPAMFARELRSRVLVGARR